MGLFEQGGDLRIGQIGDAPQVVRRGLGQTCGAGIAVEQFEHPAGSEMSLTSRASSGKANASNWWNWLITRVRCRTAACSRPAI